MDNTVLEKRLMTLIRRWASRLGISDYAYGLELRSEKALHGNYAEVHTDEETREVTIGVNRYRLLKEPKEVERTLIHELLHTRLNEYAEFVLTIINGYVGNTRTKRVLNRQLERLEHKIVVALTDVLLKGRRDVTLRAGQSA